AEKPTAPGLAALAGGWLWRLALGVVLGAHLVAFLAPQALTALHRAGATVVLEGVGGTAALLCLVGVWGLWRGRAGRPWGLADNLLLALVTLNLLSGLGVALRYHWGSLWYGDTVLPYLVSLARLKPELAQIAELPLAARLHLASGFLALALAPASSLGALLALPWFRLRQRPALVRRLAATAAACVLLALGALATSAMMNLGYSQGYEPAQPIAFSHKLHAGTHQIPCLYCHFGAERSRHAGIPPANVCMNCHARLKVATPEIAKLKEAVVQDRSIAWVKIHNLPDFVYFNHSQHVVVAGLTCQRCHGPVENLERVRQEAPLSMGWCVDCHRSEGVVPRHGAQTPAADGKPPRGMGGLDCGKCHY
nr:cytochrome c3 family protein [Thermoanaerobaculia bacterium]